MKSKIYTSVISTNLCSNCVDRISGIFTIKHDLKFHCLVESVTKLTFWFYNTCVLPTYLESFVEKGRNSKNGPLMSTMQECNIISVTNLTFLWPQVWKFITLERLKIETLRFYKDVGISNLLSLMAKTRSIKMLDS